MSFATQDGMSTISGEGAHRGITARYIGIGSSVTVTIDRFIITEGQSDNGGGIYANFANINVSNSVISDNTAEFSGGGIDLYSGTPEHIAVITNSVISNNKSGIKGGGISNSFGSLSIINSTISGNSAQDGGGLWGSASLSNVTITNNAASSLGGGIYAANGSFKNTIIAGNIGPTSSPDCLNYLTSQGYNLIGNATGCLIVGDTTGNITGVDAGLFTLFGLPAYHPLRADSPAIDAGNPAGCTDNLNVLLATDQRGSARSLDGDSDASFICDIGAYEFDPANPITITQKFLPFTALNYCPDLFDTFGNSASGWPIGEDDLVRYGYLNCEYQVFSKSDQYLYLFRAPGCTRQNYVVEMDARWEGAPGSSYGLIFGLSGDFSPYYLFDMNTDFQLFRLLRIDPGGFATIAPVTSSSAIYPGTATNHLKATRNGTAVTLEVNGTVLGTWYDGAVTGLTYAGLMSAPYVGSPTSDARFDNFRITGLPSTAAAVSVMSNTATPTSGSNIVPTHRRSPLADLAQWTENSSLQGKSVER